MRRTVRIAAAFILVLGIGAGIYVNHIYHSVKNTMSTIYEPIEPLAVDPMTSIEGEVSKSTAGRIPLVHTSTEVKQPASLGENQDDRSVDLSKKEPFTLLLLGVDERPQDDGRSDSIVVLGINPAKHSVLMFNIPRDTRVEIAGKGKMDKINHAYAFGGVNMAVHTADRFLNIPINYYVKVNMEGFEKIIDILGGVEVDNPFEFTYEGITYPKGKVALDGHDALMYSRMRYDDPRGDLGRNERQQRILAGLIENAKSISTLTKLPQILDQIEMNAKTNLTMDDMKMIFNHYREEINAVNKDGVFGEGGRMNDIYYYLVSDKERARIHEQLAEQLGE